MTIETIEPRLNGTVVREPPGSALSGGIGGFGFGDTVLYYASVADSIPAWGGSPGARDRELRNFWHTEPVLASAMFTTVSKYAAFGWQLKGKGRDAPRTVKIYEKILHGAEFGQGWLPFITKVLIDLFTQDNGAFIEIVRTADDPIAPVVGINHLDSNRCVRTGKAQEPVIYWDLFGVPHVMKWYQIIPLAEFPSPVENMRGMQYCTVTRMLRAAQVMKDISVYKREKISGRFTKTIYLASGVQTKTINDAMASHQINADAQNLSRYIQPLILAALDPTARVSVEKIDLASLPDGFSEEESMRWYINQLALAFGADYQEYAPMPGGGLGSSRQSETLHLKTKGKGPRLFMNLIEHQFNRHGVLPNNIEFSFGDQDLSDDLDKTKLRIMRAEERAMRIKSGEISPEVAREIAVEFGDLDEKYLSELASYVTPEEAQIQAQQDAAKLAAANGGPAGNGGAGGGGKNGAGVSNHDPSGDSQVGKPTQGKFVRSPA